MPRMNSMARKIGALLVSAALLFAACGPVNENDIGSSVGDVFEDTGEDLGG
jgi:hypothetical protein